MQKGRSRRNETILDEIAIANMHMVFSISICTDQF